MTTIPSPSSQSGVHSIAPESLEETEITFVNDFDAEDLPVDTVRSHMAEPKTEPAPNRFYAGKTRQNIVEGAYNNTLSYPTQRESQAAGIVGQPEIQARRKAFRQEELRVRRNFMNDALQELGLRDHPKGELAFDKAWDTAHSGGLTDVIDELECLAALMLP